MQRSLTQRYLTISLLTFEGTDFRFRIGRVLDHFAHGFHIVANEGDARVLQLDWIVIHFEAENRKSKIKSDKAALNDLGRQPRVSFGYLHFFLADVVAGLTEKVQSE